MTTPVFIEVPFELSLTAARTDALFASALQRSDEPDSEQVRKAIGVVVKRVGFRGVVALVAQEFGDHPEAAVDRMRWARSVVGWTYTASSR